MFASIRTQMTKIVRDEEGATAIEYGLLAAMISVVIIPAVVLIGPKLLNAFQTIADKLPAGG